jgi:flagellar basal-body rod protein FlgB
MSTTLSPVVHTTTTRVLSLALDAAAMRQQAHALNIARAGIAGQPSLQVNFEAQLERARYSLEREGRVSGDSLAGVSPRLEARPVGGNQDAPHLDAETLRLAQNTVQFQALLRGLDRHLGTLAQAVGDGRR